MPGTNQHMEYLWKSSMLRWLAEEDCSTRSCHSAEESSSIWMPSFKARIKFTNPSPSKRLNTLSSLKSRIALLHSVSWLSTNAVYFPSKDTPCQPKSLSCFSQYTLLKPTNCCHKNIILLRSRRADIF